MQIGTRWPVGTPAPSSVPAAVAEAVLRVEADAQLIGGWTLTWLESRAVATHDCGLRVVELETGHAATLNPGESELDVDDDDWLA